MDCSGWVWWKWSVVDDEFAGIEQRPEQLAEAFHRRFGGADIRRRLGEFLGRGRTADGPEKRFPDRLFGTELLARLFRFDDVRLHLVIAPFELHEGDLVIPHLPLIFL